jgi:serine/threonine protein kinase
MRYKKKNTKRSSKLFKKRSSKMFKKRSSKMFKKRSSKRPSKLFKKRTYMKIKRNKLSYRKNKIRGGGSLEAINISSKVIKHASKIQYASVNDQLNLVVNDVQFSNNCLDFRDATNYNKAESAVGEAISEPLFDILFKMKDATKLTINNTTTLKGEGTYGKVYEDTNWFDAVTGHKYLLKEHTSEGKLDSDAAHDLINEFKLGVKLLDGLDAVNKKYLSPSKYMVIYPNILPIFIVPDAGVSLTLIRKTRSFTFPEICKIGLDITKGLKIMHGHIESDTQGEQKYVPIIHRDIKCDNIVLSLNGDDSIDHASIIDFGLSMNCTASETYDGEGDDIKVSTCGTYYIDTAGTPLYMAPEVLLGELYYQQYSKYYGESVDIYSWACVMVELITGLDPWTTEYKESNISTTEEVPFIVQQATLGIHPGKKFIDVYTLQLKLTGYNAVADRFRQCITMAFGRVLYKTSSVKRLSAETIVDILQSIHDSLVKGPCAVFHIVSKGTKDRTTYYDLYYTVDGAVDGAVDESVEQPVALGWFRYSELRAIYDTIQSTDIPVFPGKGINYGRQAKLVSWLNEIILKDTIHLIPLYEFLLDLPKEL